MVGRLGAGGNASTRSVSPVGAPCRATRLDSVGLRAEGRLQQCPLESIQQPAYHNRSGGGTFLLNGDRVRFGIKTKYNKNSDAEKSSLIRRAHARGRHAVEPNEQRARGAAIDEDPTVPIR